MTSGDRQISVTRASGLRRERARATTLLPLLVLVLGGWVVGCTANHGTKAPDGAADMVSQTVDGDGGSDAAAICADLENAYRDLLSSAGQCTLGADNQCGVKVAASFFCNCTTKVNGHADDLAAIFDRYRAADCLTPCNGSCLQARAFACQADSTSSTGARCKEQAILNLTGADNGGSFSVKAGSEIDIFLQDIGSSQYATEVMLSSDAATVLEITIPAGPPDPAGLMHLYRIAAMSPGQVVVQIPGLSSTGDAASPAFVVTIDIQ